MSCSRVLFFFFFNDTATTEIYTLSLHDALPIAGGTPADDGCPNVNAPDPALDRKSTRLNSSHVRISYAVFCLKKKNNTTILDCDEHNRSDADRKHPLAGVI